MANAQKTIAAIQSAMRMAQAGRIDDAIALLAGGANGVLDHPGGSDLLGRLYFQTGRMEPALAAFDAALRLAPTVADGHVNRGVVLQELGRRDEALAAYDVALRHAPNNATAHFNRGNILKLMERPDEAAAAFTSALAAAPAMGEARLNRGRVHLDRRDFHAALADFDAVLAADPQSVDAAVGHATALFRLRDPSAALVSIDAALARAPQRVDAGLVRGRILLALGRDDAALDAFAAVEGKPGAGAKPQIFRSAILAQLGRDEEARAAAEDAIRIDPADTQAHETLAVILLATGDYARGFAELEHRLGHAGAHSRDPLPGVPLWQGENLAGRRIAIVAEQGIGDTIQFLRYAGRLAEAGADVVGLVPAPLLTIARSYPGRVAWTDTPRALGPVDFKVPVLSLPLRFATRADTVPADVPYLSSDVDRVAAWRSAIGTDGFRIGINWQGNPGYENDRRRSVPLAAFALLAAIPGVRLISLQAVNGLDQLAALPSGVAVETLGAKITDNPDGLAEIAAAIGALDLVVTSDTAVAHLAGALGAPVWVALGKAPDWRWGRAGTVSPWYPTMRLFRQKTPGDWQGVFAEIAIALAAEAVAAR